MVVWAVHHPYLIMAINLPYPYPDLSTQTWDAFALLSNLQFLADRITAIQAGQLMPVGALVMFRTGSTCPSGYTKVTDATLADRYLRINLASGGATGGTSSASVTDPGHTHGVGTYVTSSKGGHTHTNSVPSSTVVVDGNLDLTTVRVAKGTHIHTITSAGAHTHGLTGASASSTTHMTFTIAPKFLDVILCQKA